MFLVTTALEESWNAANDILFLGKWCTLFKRKNIWGEFSYTIADYHWNNRNKLVADYQYLEDVYEKSLDKLSINLNNLHGQNHSQDYWRIVIGPWLRYFINIVFDRYFSLIYAKMNHNISNTWIIDYRGTDWTPLDFKEFHNVFTTDQYNHYLFSQIIKELKLCPYETKNVATKDGLSKTSPNNKPSLKQRLGKKIFSLSPSSMKNILFLNSGFNKSDSYSLLRSLGQWPTEVDWFKRVVGKEKDADRRKSIYTSNAGSEFEKLLEKLLPDQLPYAYIENYDEICKNASRLKLEPKIIFTVSGARYNDDDCYKIWAAGRKEKGSLFILGQHGGNFGSALFCDSEAHQVKVSDYYFSWGWNKDGIQNVIPMPSAKLLYAKQNIKSKEDGEIAWLLNEGRRYAYRLASFPIATQWEDYFSDQKRFLKACSAEVKEKLVLRPHPKASHSWSAIERIIDNNEQIKIVPKGISMHEQLSNSSICICTFNTTAHLETMAANFPTLIFWNPEHWEIRPEAEKVHEELVQAGILWFNAEKAAQKLNEVCQDINDWWESDEVQSARGLFVNSFANTSENILDVYHKRILKLIR